MELEQVLNDIGDYDGGSYYIETSPLICSIIDDLHHEKNNKRRSEPLEQSVSFYSGNHPMMKLG